MKHLCVKCYMNLGQGRKGKCYKILKIKNSGEKISRRFLELGLTSGQRVKVVATSFSNKVFLVEIRGYVLSIRANLLSVVEVAEC